MLLTLLFLFPQTPPGTSSLSALPVTLCDQVERKICAEDFCRVVEGEEEVVLSTFVLYHQQLYFKCEDDIIENTVNVPEETCDLEPEEVCRNVTVRY